MTFHLTFDMDNDAFSPDWHDEAAKILATVAQHVRDGCASNTIRDTNGNKVGRFYAESD